MDLSEGDTNMNANLAKIISCALPVAALAGAIPQALGETPVPAPPVEAPSDLVAWYDKGALPAGDVRVSELLGRDLVDRHGRAVGEIRDLIVETLEDGMAYAVVSAGDYLGMEDRIVEIPLDRITLGMDDQPVLGATSAELRTFRMYFAQSWPNDSRAGPPMGEVGRATNGPRFHRASRLLDADLRDYSGADVGDVEDIIVNLGSGRVRYAVAEFDPSWFEKARLVAMPLSKVASAGAGGRDLVVRVDRDLMRRAGIAYASN
jgi:sporulation protein YlmC with PRC-barrel domain